MASFFGSYVFILTGSSPNYTIGSFTATDAATTDGEPGQTFEDDDTIDVSSPDLAGPLSLNYLGSFDGGWIGEGSGIPYLITNNFYPGGDPVPLSSDPFTTCFLEGTQIATPSGERAIEALAIGDVVLGADGQARPVRWIGRQSVVTVFADVLRNFPIRIAAGALGESLPRRDLFVSPDHGMLVDGLLVQAAALANGTTIRQMPPTGAAFTYFHIELADHALVLAEGAPAETFVDNVTRRRFDNFAEFEALYGDGGEGIAELDLPRVKSARQLPRGVRERLAARAVTLGWPSSLAA